LKEVYLLKQGDGKTSKGAAFVKYSRREDAERAINALHGRHKDKDAPGPVQVRFAHTKQEKAILAQGPVAPSPYLQAPPQQVGWGFAVGQGGYGAHGAMGGGMGSAMAAHQQQQSMGQQQQQYGQVGLTSGGPPPLPWPAAQPAPSPLAYAPSAASQLVQAQKELRGPSGANVFIYNLPLTFTDSDLAGLFSTFGVVLSAHVQRDRTTGASKGFGFVSFQDPAAANGAIAALDGFVVGTRKLSVRLKKDGVIGGPTKPY